MTDKPIGGVAEYDLLNSLVASADQAIVERSLSIHDATGWGICRCRMAAIIEATTRRMSWPVASEARCVLLAKWPGR